MYATIFEIKFFNKKPPYDLYVIASQVVELEKLYLFAYDDF